MPYDGRPGKLKVFDGSDLKAVVLEGSLEFFEITPSVGSSRRLADQFDLMGSTPLNGNRLSQGDIPIPNGTKCARYDSRHFGMAAVYTEHSRPVVRIENRHEDLSRSFLSRLRESDKDVGSAFKRQRSTMPPRQRQSEVFTG
jgi:hypothetical protein